MPKPPRRNRKWHRISVWEPMVTHDDIRTFRLNLHLKNTTEEEVIGTLIHRTVSHGAYDELLQFLGLAR